MDAHFFRSERFLQSDRFIKSNAGLSLALFLLAAWFAWFFLARVTIYQVSEQAVLQDESHLISEFSPSALALLRTGQPAQLRLDDFPWMEFGLVSAEVTKIEFQDGVVQVVLSLRPDSDGHIPFQAGLSGVVAVEVDHVSPAAFVFRTITKSLSQNGLPVDQQKKEPVEEGNS